MTLSAHKARWYINRLRAMSPAEIAHRFSETARRRISAKRRYTFDSARSDIPFLSFDPSRLKAIDESTLSRWRRLIPRGEAPGTYRALGQEFELSPEIDWHRDPQSGQRWPSDAYCFDIDYRNDHSRGDIKFVWELNRLQFLPVMAALSVIDGDDDLADLSVRMIESWINANPPFKGVNWVSGIELALRAVSILLTIGLIGPDRINDRLARKIDESLSAHAYWLKRFPSRFSSANNHLIAEAAARFILGTLGISQDAESDANAARESLVVEARRQIYDDGVGAEQSPTYTAFTCEWYLLAFALAEQIGRPFPVATIARIAAAGEYLRWNLDSAGNHPRIGDDDEGRVISSGEGHEPLYVSSIVNAIAAQPGHRDLATSYGTQQLRNCLLGRPPVPAPDNFGTRTFADGGYTVSKRIVGNRSALVVIDHGPLGYLSIAAHGHADALSVMLHLDSIPVLVDAGTFLYHSGGATRDHLRGTPVHNTVCIDGKNQSEISGAFNWSRKANCWLVGVDEHGGQQTITARHDGYAGSHGLLCERSVTIDEDGITISDQFLSAGDRSARAVSSIRSGFLLHPDCSAILEDRDVVVLHSGAPILRFVGGSELKIELEDAEYSPAFGMTQPAVRVVFVVRNLAVRRFHIQIMIEPRNFTDDDKSDIVIRDVEEARRSGGIPA
jgi:uncharacterized heparinase superfamily protein